MKLKTNDNLVIKDETPIKLDIVDTISNSSSIESTNSDSIVNKIENTPSTPKSISFNNTDRAVSPTGRRKY